MAPKAKPLLFGLLLVMLVGLVSLTSTFAYGGYGKGKAAGLGTGVVATVRHYQGTNTGSATFVDKNKDGICDKYATRPQDGSGKKYGRLNLKSR